MDKSSLKLECLKLAVTCAAHKGPEEILTLAGKFESYCETQTVPSSPVKNKEVPTEDKKQITSIPLPGVVGPVGGGKDHKK